MYVTFQCVKREGRENGVKHVNERADNFFIIRSLRNVCVSYLRDVWEGISSFSLLTSICLLITMQRREKQLMNRRGREEQEGREPTPERTGIFLFCLFDNWADKRECETYSKHCLNWLHRCQKMKTKYNHNSLFLFPFYLGSRTWLVRAIQMPDIWLMGLEWLM